MDKYTVFFDDGSTEEVEGDIVVKDGIFYIQKLDDVTYIIPAVKVLMIKKEIETND